MMRTKRLGALLLVLALVAGAFYARLRPPYVWIAHVAYEKIKPDMAYEKIKSDMSESDVEAVLGGRPPGDYRTRSGIGYSGILSGCFPPLGTPRKWEFNSGCITVWFEDGKVVNQRFDHGFRGTTWLEQAIGKAVGKPVGLVESPPDE